MLLINSIFVLAPMLRLLDAFPRNGDLLLLPTLLVFRFLGTLCAGGLVIVGSMVGDVKDENELPTGQRNEGVFFGAYSLADKTAAGLGHFLAGIALDLIAFPVGAGAADVVSPENVRNLGILFAPGVLVLGILAALSLSRYRLSGDEHGRIHAELDAREA